MHKYATQGLELDVLRGASGLFAQRKVRFVLVEMSIRLLPGHEGTLRAGGAFVELRAKLKTATEIIDLLASQGFLCCDLAWHDDIGRLANRSTNRARQAVDARAWAHALAQVPRGKNGFYFTDLLCEQQEPVEPA